MCHVQYHIQLFGLKSDEIIIELFSILVKLSFHKNRIFSVTNTTQCVIITTSEIYESWNRVSNYFYGVALIVTRTEELERWFINYIDISLHTVLDR